MCSFLSLYRPYSVHLCPDFSHVRFAAVPASLSSLFRTSLPGFLKCTLCGRSSLSTVPLSYASHWAHRGAVFCASTGRKRTQKQPGSHSGTNNLKRATNAKSTPAVRTYCIKTACVRSIHDHFVEIHAERIHARKEYRAHTRRTNQKNIHRSRCLSDCRFSLPHSVIDSVEDRPAQTRQEPSSRIRERHF